MNVRKPLQGRIKRLKRPGRGTGEALNAGKSRARQTFALATILDQEPNLGSERSGVVHTLHGARRGQGIVDVLEVANMLTMQHRDA